MSSLERSASCRLPCPVTAQSLGPAESQTHSRSWAQGFDRNNFAETEESLALLKRLGPDVMLVEGKSPSPGIVFFLSDLTHREIVRSSGYRELMTSRLHLVDMPTHLGLAYVPLDGIGCTFALVKAHVHREGVTFPTWVFDNEVCVCPFRVGLRLGIG